MTRLPDKSEAVATLKRNGYVRLGDHSATNLETLEEIYATRNEAWLDAEKRGIMLPPPAPSGIDPTALASAVAAGMLAARKAWEAEEADEAPESAVEAPAADKAPETSTAVDGLDSMSLPELKAKAAELGIAEFPAVGTSKATVIAAIRAKTQA